jgi:hypothetical protein
MDMKRLVIACMVVVSGGYMVCPAVAEPASDARKAWTVDSIPWQAAAPNGTRYALLEGVRDHPDGAFSYAFFIPAGTWDSPHWHSTTARVFVAKGSLRIGYGAKLDRNAATTYPAGSYVLVPARAVHFDGADVDTIIVGVATGIWATTYLDGSKPASAGTPLR